MLQNQIKTIFKRALKKSDSKKNWAFCENFGRPAKEPEMMFKLLFLKKLYDLSDEALISSAQTDMAYKFFLDLEPEAKMIDPSLLTKFRKTRITEDILEEMLKETIQQALIKI